MRSPSISQTEDNLHELNAGKVGSERWHLLSEKLIHKSQEERVSLQQATSIHTYGSRASAFPTAFHHPAFNIPFLPLPCSSVTFKQLLPDLLILQLGLNLKWWRCKPKTSLLCQMCTSCS